MRRPRLRSALLVAAVLSAGVPTVALATAPALHCRGLTTSGSWQRIRVDAFPAVNGLSSPDTVTGYALDEKAPQNVVATNGVRILRSTDHGCDWSDDLALSPTPTGSQSFTGIGSAIVSMAVLGGTRVAAVREGSGAASRPHVLVASGGDWATADSGLPSQGAPTLLRAANDGRTLYLSISPVGGTGGGSGGSTGLPGVPVTGGGTVGGQTGLLYASTDRGRTWQLRTTPGDVGAAGAGFTALDVDVQDSNRLYGIVDGHLAVSSDGGSSFLSPLGGTSISALTAMGPLTLAAFSPSGRVYYSTNGGGGFASFPTVSGVTSVGYRQGDQDLLVERSGVLTRVSVFSNAARDVPAGVTPRTGSVTGDRSEQASWHALAGHSLLRFVDPVPRGTVIPPIAVGDTSVPPPIPGVVVPASQAITLPVGQSGTVPFTLELPKNPTPLDLFFLVDASQSMSDYIKDIKANLRRIVAALEAQHVDLKVGVGTLGSGPRERGEVPYPQAYVYPPSTTPGAPPKKYVRPQIYHRIRAVGDTGAELQAAINAIEIESDDLPSGSSVGGPRIGGAHEGQLLALQQMSFGRGLQWRSEVGTNIYQEQTPPGMGANWRNNQAVRRIAIVATDEAFDDPYPQKHDAAERPYFDDALRDLRAKRTQVIGLTAGDPSSLPDLRRVAAGTGSLAPPGGVYCGTDPTTGLAENLAAGQPMVCNSGDHFADAIIRLLSSLVDRQSVSLVPLAKSPVLGGLQGSALTGLDVKKPNAAPFTVNVTCAGVKAGRYGGDVAAVLRGTKVGSAHVTVTCVKAAAAVPPRPLEPPPVAQPPAPQPPAPPALPPPPPAPAVQAQVQVQTQVQVNPMSAGAMQEQQELQLALALNGTLKDDDPAFNPAAASQMASQMGMVDRRKREQVQAMYLLAFAMVTCSALGLARLRSTPGVRVRRAS